LGANEKTSFVQKPHSKMVFENLKFSRRWKVDSMGLGMMAWEFRVLMRSNALVAIAQKFNESNNKNKNK